MNTVASGRILLIDSNRTVSLGTFTTVLDFGHPAFQGETVSDVIARILEREADWDALPASAPTRLRDVMQRCLTKDVAERPRDIGDLRRELSAIAQQLSSPGARSAARSARTLTWFC